MTWDFESLLKISSRWLHVIVACLAIGGLFFMRFILPHAVKILNDADRAAVVKRARKAFTILIHSGILLLVATGIYNTILNWRVYQQNPPLFHSFWGTHVLLAAAVFTIFYTVIGRRNPSPRLKMFMTINFVLLLAAVAAASTVKFVRENYHPAATPSNPAP